MDGDEATALLNSIDFKGREEWERIRWIGFINAITAGAKIKKPTDLITFEWEEAKDVVKEIRSDEEIKASLQDLANTFSVNTIIKDN